MPAPCGPSPRAPSRAAAGSASGRPAPGRPPRTARRPEARTAPTRSGVPPAASRPRAGVLPIPRARGAFARTGPNPRRTRSRPPGARCEASCAPSLVRAPARHARVDTAPSTRVFSPRTVRPDPQGAANRRHTAAPRDSARIARGSASTRGRKPLLAGVPSRVHARSPGPSGRQNGYKTRSGGYNPGVPPRSASTENRRLKSGAEERT